MAGKKKINWSLNEMLMLSEIYDYLETQIGDVKAANYLDDLMDFGNALDKKSTHFSYCRNQNYKQRAIAVLPFAANTY